jgi:hypothetical protein
VDRTDSQQHDARRLPRWALWLGAALVTLVVLGMAVPPLFDERMRSTIEAQMNARLEGYSVRVDDVDLHLFGLSLTLKDVTVTQDAHPEPPVAQVPIWRTSVEWRKLLRGQLVADFLFDGPVLYLNLEQLREEMDETVDERGWREALEAAHFFAFNLIRVRNGQLTYVDADPDLPLHASDIEFVVADIRASPGPDEPYPSPFQLQTQLFGRGQLRVDGHGDFLAEPTPALLGRFDAVDVPLRQLRPVLARAGMILTDGFLDAHGSAELAPNGNRLHVEQLHAHQVHMDYIHTGDDDDDDADDADDAGNGRDEDALLADDDENGNGNGNDDGENGNGNGNGNGNDDGRNGNGNGNDDGESNEENGEDENGNGNDIGEAIESVAEGPDPEVLELHVEHAILTGELGLVNEAEDPSFRVYLGDVTLTVTNYSNRFLAGPADVHLEGRFMGSGQTQASARLRPERERADFDLQVEIRETHLPAMNDILMAYGNFDVVGGRFSFFSELTVRDGQIEGYMRPLFRDMEVYDAREDDDKGLIQQLYERAIGAIARILENIPRDEVATHVEISGDLDDPEMSTWDIIVGLLRNAFFQAILPGFEDEVG